MLTKETAKKNPSDLVQDTSADRSRQYRDAMSLLGGAVNIITSNGPSGKVGFAATAVCSVSDQPPTLLVCTNRSSTSYRPIIENAVLCVNTLSSSSEELARIFGGQRGKIVDRFAHGEWTIGQTGAPILASAIASFDCRLLNAYENGTHDIFVCEVISSISRAEADGLFYYKRTYRTITD
jgi:flavin reductase